MTASKVEIVVEVAFMMKTLITVHMEKQGAGASREYLDGYMSALEDFTTLFENYVRNEIAKDK